MKIENINKTYEVGIKLCTSIKQRFFFYLNTLCNLLCEYYKLQKITHVIIVIVNIFLYFIREYDYKTFLFRAYFQSHLEYCISITVILLTRFNFLKF